MTVKRKKARTPFRSGAVHGVHGESLNRIGIFWESLFLPVGTQLRTSHCGNYKYGKIQGTEEHGVALTYEGKQYVSVAQMARAMRGQTNVNAWRYIEIRRPGDTSWQRALQLRGAMSTSAARGAVTSGRP